MKTFFISTLGCKVNQYESQQIREFLEMLGLQQAEVGQQAGLVVINSCCVTQSASAKSRQSIQKAQRLHPQASIVVTGCLPVVQTGELKNPGKNVRLIRNRDDLADTLSQMVPDQKAESNSENLQNNIRPKNEYKIKTKNSFPKLPSFSELTSFKGHTRADSPDRIQAQGQGPVFIINSIRNIQCPEFKRLAASERHTVACIDCPDIVINTIRLNFDRILNSYRAT